MKLNPTTVVAGAAVLMAMSPLTNAEAKQLVLNCDISEGAPEAYRSIQIMVDEEKKIVIYHFELVGSDPIKQGAGGRPIDLSMKITIDDGDLIMANDYNGGFLMTKHDGHFVHAWVTAVPAKSGTFIPYANIHSGSCVKSPFD